MKYIIYDQDSNEVEVDAAELVRRALDGEWTITGDVADAIRELCGDKL